MSSTPALYLVTGICVCNTLYRWASGSQRTVPLSLDCIRFVGGIGVPYGVKGCRGDIQDKQNFKGAAPLTPPKRVTRFPRLEEGNVPINTSWFGLFLGISRVLGESSTARGYPSADSRPIRKADCVSKKNPLQNTEVNRREI
ncbi:hypothetical protein TNCV_1903961 [Trichonephila clavipes]|nr:hypothetical protein TNCV_1903961 [Trichonephila clavipes]